MWSDTYSERNTVQYEKKKEDVLDYGLFTKGCHEKKKTKSEHVSDQLFLAWTQNYMMAAYSYTREQVLG